MAGLLSALSVERRALVSLLLFLALCFGVAAFAARFEPGAWYAALAKPPWNPPDWVFAPVWSVLYAAIAVAGWLVWRTGRSAARSRALALWALQLALNAAWSWLFFGLQRPGLALAEISALLVAIVATIAACARVRPAAAALLLPYLLWVGFAAALNFALWRLNTLSVA